MQNRELKKELIENGKSTFYRKTRSDFIKANGMELLDDIMYEEEFMKMIFDCTNEEILECERIRVNARKQRKKIEDHLKFLVQGNWCLFFLTLTFTDECLDRTTPETRKRTITRLLSSFCDDYILNIDYGKENEREHYHAIISVLNKNCKLTKDEEGHLRLEQLSKGYKYGFYSIEMIRTRDNDIAKLSRYITKLTMHSIKVRQSYVTVKKGSPYQKWKTLKANVMRNARQPERCFKPDFDEEETWLMSGYATEFDA